MPLLAPRLLLRSWYAIGWFGLVLLVYLSLTPQPVDIPVENGDKVGHAAAYAVLTFWWLQLMDSLKRRMLFVAALLALGIAIEYIQRWTGYRTFDYYDMLADAAGIAVGWLIASPRTPNLLSWLGGPGLRRIP
jgi:VanZ family protein